ncbi:hypothetical protein BDK51DRAFT_36964 [Blyttiomyces helicus]|uniref:Uncharacterized protein n=1 Tax=Blyttiomyces helicus TaxID=388810 RepID=A0A4P9VZ12_9FUNG|nr:hypothetical protein BDK51DRAFT_36964 [Blyttiomyces helicus]|eukprot:RKO83580.1 hypothetical protein BDK51DRAFT_36964 [Blyttiomyces helicus]
MREMQANTLVINKLRVIERLDLLCHPRTTYTFRYAWWVVHYKDIHGAEKMCVGGGITSCLPGCTCPEPSISPSAATSGSPTHANAAGTALRKRANAGTTAELKATSPNRRLSADHESLQGSNLPEFPGEPPRKLSSIVQERVQEFSSVVGDPSPEQRKAGRFSRRASTGATTGPPPRESDITSSADAGEPVPASDAPKPSRPPLLTVKVPQNDQTDIYKRGYQDMEAFLKARGPMSAGPAFSGGPFFSEPPPPLPPKQPVAPAKSTSELGDIAPWFTDEVEACAPNPSESGSDSAFSRMSIPRSGRGDWLDAEVELSPLELTPAVRKRLGLEETLAVPIHLTRASSASSMEAEAGLASSGSASSPKASTRRHWFARASSSGSPETPSPGSPRAPRVETGRKGKGFSGAEERPLSGSRSASRDRAGEGDSRDSPVFPLSIEIEDGHGSLSRSKWRSAPSGIDAKDDEGRYSTPTQHLRPGAYRVRPEPACIV